MAICFQSLRSSSSGNCLALWTAHSAILIDCGMTAQYQCDALLEELRQQAGTIDGLLVSHAHTDHIGYPALRVLQHHGIRVHADRNVIRALRERHRVDDWDEAPTFEAFAHEGFKVGDFRVTTFAVPHEPGVPTFGFVIVAHDGRVRRKIVVCTDFYDFAEALPRFVDADLIFVEANHDLELLRRHPNYASRWHLSNPKTASLLYHAVRRSAAPPRAVLLGHLSEERNRRRLALEEITRAFSRRAPKLAFHLEAAPAYRPSAVVEM